MADYEELFPGRFLKAADLKGQEVTLTIKSVYSEEIEDKVKAIFTFEGTKKMFVCNRTNAEACRLCLGRDHTKWVGHRITIYPAKMKDPFGDGEIIAIRVLGSPEISQPITAEVKRGRKTLKISVRPTGRPAAKPSNGKPAAAAQTPAPSSPPSSEPTEEEKAAIAAAEFQQAADDGLPS